MIPPSMPAALAAAARRRAMDWPLSPAEHLSVGSGRSPDRCTVIRSRSWRSATAHPVLKARRRQCRPDRFSRRAGRRRPARRPNGAPPLPTGAAHPEQQTGNRFVHGAPLGGGCPHPTTVSPSEPRHPPPTSSETACRTSWLHLGAVASVLPSAHLVNTVVGRVGPRHGPAGWSPGKCALIDTTSTAAGSALCSASSRHWPSSSGSRSANAPLAQLAGARA